MLRILERADRAALDTVEKSLSYVASVSGLTWPFFLLAWRVAFWVPLFILAAMVVAGEGTALSYAGMAVIAVLAEVARKQAAPLVGEIRREWTAAMFNRYALMAMVKRQTLFAMRLLTGFNAVVLFAAALYGLLSGEAFGHPFIALAYFSIVIAFGGWTEAAMPPLPGEGDREPAAVPRLA